jgi:hypothetical protein
VVDEEVRRIARGYRRFAEVLRFPAATPVGRRLGHLCLYPDRYSYDCDGTTVGRFVLSLDGRPPAWTAPHGGRIDWFAAGRGTIGR